MNILLSQFIHLLQILQLSLEEFVHCFLSYISCLVTYFMVYYY